MVKTILYLSSVATATEQNEQQDQDPDPFVVLENITEASHIFILSLSNNFAVSKDPASSSFAALVSGYAGEG